MDSVFPAEINKPQLAYLARCTPDDVFADARKEAGCRDKA
jgi:hypothetical protein